MTPTDTELLDWLEERVYLVRTDNRRGLGVAVPTESPSAGLRVAIARAMETGDDEDLLFGGDA